MPERVQYRSCPLCEATCNLKITTRDREVVSIRGDELDPFSHGFICPKGAALKDLDADPDRLRTPLVRRGDTFEPATWDEAFAEIERRLPPLLRAHGGSSAALYFGNPSAHNPALTLYLPVIARALGTSNIYSASTVDQMPKQVSAGLMFGTSLSVPIPDIDRTDYWMILGANPLVSNGSLMTAPDVPERLAAIRRRGGKVVVIDPRRTRTADAASEHVFIRPGADAFFLFALVHVLFADDLVQTGALTEHLNGLDTVRTLAADFAPERVATRCGVDAPTMRRLAHELAAAKTAAVYGRIGTCTQEYGVLASWLVDVVNILTGNLDRAGGAMFTTPLLGAANTFGAPGRGKGVRFGRRHSRVRRAPEVFGEFPAACLAEEIETPGEGQIRALITIAGNPVLSTPNGARLAKALPQLDFMVSLDIYLNETSRHAHVILPGLSPLENMHYDVALWNFAIRNYAKYSAPVFSPPPDRPAEWETILRLAGIAMGQGAQVPISTLDDFTMRQRMEPALRNEHSPVHGRDADELLAAMQPWTGADRALDWSLRTGPYGDGFGKRPGGLTLATLATHEHGLDKGPLVPRIPEVLRTPTGKIELAPPAIVADVARLHTGLAAAPESMTLVGRRDLRSNNSWMHNLRALMKDGARCTLQIHPTDAARAGITRTARVRSRVGTVDVPVDITESIMPGVVSLPHGWGHDAPGAQLRIAGANPGTNSNLLADEASIEPLSGNAVLCGIPVTVEAAS
jgi:anaerobic selenocysteine-containing dehydrogenase